MQCEYRDNAQRPDHGRRVDRRRLGPATASTSVFREVDQDDLAGAHRLAAVPGGNRRAVRAADPPPTSRRTPYVPPDPMLEIDRDTMRRLGETRRPAPRGTRAAPSRPPWRAYHATVFPPDPHLAGADAERPPRPVPSPPDPRRPEPCASQ